MSTQPENLRSVLGGFAGLVLIAIVTWVAGSPVLAIIFGLGALAAFVVTATRQLRSVPRNILPLMRR